MYKKKVQLFTIAFETIEGREVVDISVSDFLNRLEAKIIDRKISPTQYIGDRKMSIFKYNRPITGEQSVMVIPFGFKKADITYKENEKDSFIVTPVTDQLYNINLIYYDEKEKVVIMTTFKAAPSHKIIEQFLNEYINLEGIRLKIRPIFKHTDLETVHNAKEVKSIDLILNLDEDINNYFNNKIKQNALKSMSHFRSISEISKDSWDGSRLSISVGLGKSRKKTLNINNIYEFLRILNLDDDFIHEIRVNYRNKESEEILPACIKKADIELKLSLEINNTIGFETVLSEKAPVLIENNSLLITERRRNYFKNLIPFDKQLLLKQPQLYIESEDIDE